MAEVENVVRDGIARGEFRDAGDVQLAVELLSGVMRAGVERIGRDPGAPAATVHAARGIILASLAPARITGSSLNPVVAWVDGRSGWS
ncbi:hypothetical protein AB0D78_40935 [Streptomyces avermitilis]|uniref:hypothetical protein n=1 Tax=Streptomyces avermitilis TaxID=33903 RepID=UPI0033E62D21